MKGRLPGEVDDEGVETPTMEAEVARLDSILSDGTLHALLIEYGVLPEVSATLGVFSRLQQPWFSHA